MTAVEAIMDFQSERLTIFIYKWPRYFLPSYESKAFSN